MAKIKYDKSGKHEAYATAWTLAIYEQQFKADMIADIYGVIDATRQRITTDNAGNVLRIDYTADHWTKSLQALWAMLYTAAEIGFMKGAVAANDRVPAYDAWIKSVGAVDINAINDFVVQEMEKGFFRSPAGNGGKTTTN